MSSEQLPLWRLLQGYWILFLGKLQGKSNNEIIAERLAKAKQRHPGDRIYSAKLDDKVERMKRGKE